MQCWVYFLTMQLLLQSPCAAGRAVGSNAVSVGLWQQDQHCDLDGAVFSPLNSEDAVGKTSVGDFFQVLQGGRQPRGTGPPVDSQQGCRKQIGFWLLGQGGGWTPMSSFSSEHFPPQAWNSVRLMHSREFLLVFFLQENHASPEFHGIYQSPMCTVYSSVSFIGGAPFCNSLS